MARGAGISLENLGYLGPKFTFTYLAARELLGIDFLKLRNFASPSEQILTDVLQKMTASRDRVPAARHLRHYLEQNLSLVEQTAEWLAGIPKSSIEKIEEIMENSVRACNDIQGATERITGLYSNMHDGWENI